MFTNFLSQIQLDQACQWFGPGSIDGQVQFSQAVPQGPTTIQVSLKNLASIAGGYHVHVLPLKPGSASPCSNADILGHFNPLAWNVSNSPSPGVGTVDQYEVGDISGKFGMLTLKDIYEGVHEDPSMPLTGPYSIVGRSLVIHHTNSTSCGVKGLKILQISDNCSGIHLY
uniref:Superoxide dismutase copper/zinc binding domain-containing protein n=1 Tax=Oryzias sinensis TaxID=183150 RepID=A0A8C8DFX4_9TELE